MISRIFPLFTFQVLSSFLIDKFEKKDKTESLHFQILLTGDFKMSFSIQKAITKSA